MKAVLLGAVCALTTSGFALADPTWEYFKNHDALRNFDVTGASLESNETVNGGTTKLILRRSAERQEVYITNQHAIFSCSSVNGRPYVLLKFDSGSIQQIPCTSSSLETVFLLASPQLIPQLAKAKSLIVEVATPGSAQQFTFNVAGLTDQWLNGGAPEGTVRFSAMSKVDVKAKLLARCAQRHFRVEEDRPDLVVCSGLYALGLGRAFYRFSLIDMGSDTLVVPGITISSGQDASGSDAMRETFNTLIDMGGRR